MTGSCQMRSPHSLTIRRPFTIVCLFKIECLFTITCSFTIVMFAISVEHLPRAHLFQQRIAPSTFQIHREYVLTASFHGPMLPTEKIYQNAITKGGELLESMNRLPSQSSPSLFDNSTDISSFGWTTASIPGKFYSESESDRQVFAHINLQEHVSNNQRIRLQHKKNTTRNSQIFLVSKSKCAKSTLVMLTFHTSLLGHSSFLRPDIQRTKRFYIHSLTLQSHPARAREITSYKSHSATVPLVRPHLPAMAQTRCHRQGQQSPRARRPC